MTHDPTKALIGSTYTDRQGRFVRVLARSWGLTLTHTSGEGWGSGYWSNSSGGGQGLRAQDDTQARAEFQAIVDRRHEYWAKLVDSRSIIVKGVHYRDGGFSTNTHEPFLGFAGHLWGIRRLSDGYSWQTNNLWHQGDVPPELGLVDTHGFVEPSTCSLTQPPTPTSGPTPSAEQQSIIDH